MTGSWRKLHDEELLVIYHFCYQIKGVRWSGLGVKRNVYRILDGKPVGRTPLDRPRHRRSDDIKIDLREIG